VIPKDAGQKVCAECGEGFTCGFAAGDGSCWCFEKPRVLPMDSGGDCLCLNCLDRAIARELKDREKLDSLLTRVGKRGKNNASRPS
jgi:hypothetical protein